MPPSPSFDPHSLYSSKAGASPRSATGPSAMPAASMPKVTAAASNGVGSSASQHGDGVERKKSSKRRKVNQACIYCRRSHMTCDDGRPCQRCLKRDIGHLCHDEATPAHGGQHAEGSDSGTPSKSAKSSSPAKYASPNDPSSSTAPTLRSDSLPATSSPSSAAAPPFFSTLGLGNSSFIAGQAGPYSSASPMASFNQSVEGFASNFKQQSSQLYPLASSSGMSAANILSLATLFQNSINGNNAGFPGNMAGATTSAPAGDMTGLGGAGWLGLGGGPTGSYDGEGSGFGGDIAGGNEFTLLSEFLESLDGSGYNAPGGMTPGAVNSSMGITPSTSRRNTVTGLANQADTGANDVTDNQTRASLPPNAALGEGLSGSIVADAPATTGKRSRRSSLSAAAKTPASTGGSHSYLPSIGEGMSSKTEKFFLTAADQKDGTRDERLARVIQAKYEAGLLRPYNHVNGYARLNRWMERNVSPASKRRILKPLSVFRPAFRAVAQSLTNIDLIFIEEAFERLLLDYDRVFSTQGIPACLWRRTGEIYKGNKEFADLIGVPIESLREGRLCIYELMAEESAVNYWEKYGAVSFDKGQKAVLTSCVLRTKNKIIVSGGTGGISGAGGASGGTGGWGINKKDRAANAISAQLPRSSGNSGQITPTGVPAKLEMTASSEPTAPPTPKKEVPAAGTGATSTSGIVKDPNNPKAAFLHCCFSFTIRRDQWNIPTMIVGNFLPTNPP